MTGRWRYTAKLLVLVSLIAGQPALAVPAQIEATGPWAVDYASDSCALRRVFGDASKPFRLELRQYEPDGRTSVTVTAPFKARGSDFRYAFAPDNKLRDMGPPDHARTSQGDGVVRFTAASLRTVDQTEEFYREMRSDAGDEQRQRLPIWRIQERDARLAAVEGLVIDNAFTDDFLLKTGPMTAPMAAMDKCFADLFKEWGLDPVAQKTLSQHATMQGPPIPHGFIDAVMRETRSSDTRIRVLLDKDGKPTSCNVLGTRPGSVAATKYCTELLATARFTPALDAAGQPVASYFLDEISVIVVVTMTAG